MVRVSGRSFALSDRTGPPVRFQGALLQVRHSDRKRGTSPGCRGRRSHRNAPPEVTARISTRDDVGGKRRDPAHARTGGKFSPSTPPRGMTDPARGRVEELMRASVWIAVLWSLFAVGVARAEDKPEAAQSAAADTASSEDAAANEAEPAQAKAPEEAPAEPSAATSTEKAEEPAASATEEPKAVEPAAQPAPAEQAAPQKAPVVKAAAQGPFQSSWEQASPDEKALFLEALGESSKAVQERWDKSTPEERRKILRAHPLLGARAMKQKWVSATPEERAAFLETSPKTVQKVREAWENATPEQRKMLALEHPYFARKALHHAWTQATPQERIAFLVANPVLHAELKARWAGANAWQRQWYVKNYPGIESLAGSKHWAEITTEQRAIFLEANPAIEDRVREAWQKTQPETRAAMARKWQGWPLKAYQARLENAKPLGPAKTRPAATTAMKKTAKAGTRRP